MRLGGFLHSVFWLSGLNSGVGRQTVKCVGAACCSALISWQMETVERSLCSVYYLPGHLSSSCFLHSPSPCSSLFFSLSYTQSPSRISVRRRHAVRAPPSFHLSFTQFLSLAQENLIFFVWAALLATSMFPSVASSLSSHFQRLFNFDFYCLLLFRTAFIF